jgi:DNA repair exonuclease SbcCD ATPase subunit
VCSKIARHWDDNIATLCSSEQEIRDQVDSQTAPLLEEKVAQQRERERIEVRNTWYFTSTKEILHTSCYWLGKHQHEIQELMDRIKAKRQELADLQRAVHATDAKIHDTQRPFTQPLDRIQRQKLDATQQREKEAKRKVMCLLSACMLASVSALTHCIAMMTTVEFNSMKQKEICKT